MQNSPNHKVVLSLNLTRYEHVLFKGWHWFSTIYSFYCIFQYFVYDL